MNKNQDQVGIHLPALRDPVVATSLSVVPGLGQIYNLEPRKGILFFLVGFTNILMIGLLVWSQQLIQVVKTISTEYNITPNPDVAHALGGYHIGSPSLNVLLVLFAAFIAYAMRDAHDRATIVRRNTIYAPSAMHIAEASSGSYLFHAALLATLVLFAFFFLLPSPPKPQVTVIEFVNPKLETKTPPRTKKAAAINAESLRDPKLDRVVRDPSTNNAGGSNQSTARASNPTRTRADSKPSRPVTEQKPQTRPASEPKQSPAKTDTKPSVSEPEEASKDTPRPKPVVQVVKPITTPSSLLNTLKPEPAQPPSLKPLPPLPTVNRSDSSPISNVDPTKLLASLTPTSTPTQSGSVPSAQSVSVKSAGAPHAVASNIAPTHMNLPTPDFASSKSSARSAGSDIVEIGSRSQKSGEQGISNSTAPRPSKGTRDGTNSATGSNKSGDVDNFIGMKPALPPGDGGNKTGSKTIGSVGNPLERGKTGSPQDAAREVDFSAYMAQLQRRIKRNWFPPTDQQSKRVTARFSIHRNGTLSNLRMASPSGSSAADNAALKAISSSAPFMPLPPNSPESVDIEFKFDYNVFRNTGTIRGW